MTKRKDKSWTPLLQRLSQLAFGVFILVASIRHALASTDGALPSTDAYCPFGGLETLWKLATQGTFISKTHPSNIVLALGLLVGTVLVGGAFCGWVCPFGGLQDLLTWVRQRLHLPELKVPARVDRVLGFGRYVVLGGILYATVQTGKMWFADYDPYRTIFSLGWLFEFNWAEAWPAYVVSLAVIVGAFFVPRLWCRYLCPLGGVISLVQRVSLFRIRRTPATCIHCKKCDKVCPVGIQVSQKKSVTAGCISCLKCVETCPVKDTLYVGLIVEPAGTTSAPKEGIA